MRAAKATGVQPETDERSIFVSALIGGQVGAVLGLVLFGGMLFVPLITAFLGSAAGPLSIVAKQRARQALAGRWIREQLRRELY